MLDGRGNRWLGWILLLVALAGGALLEPWSFSERDPSVLPGSPRMIARHAQAVLVGMAFLQLVVAGVLAGVTLANSLRAAVSVMTGVGALFYAAGYGLVVVSPDFAWLAAAGAVMNFAGFAILAGAVGNKVPIELRAALAVFCLGMLLDAGMGLFTADPTGFLPGYLGGETGLRLRMLRLARAAVIALSLLVLLFRGLAERTKATGVVANWGQALLLAGAIAMPLTLALAAFTTVDLKYLLPLAAQSTFWGTLAGLWLARRARFLEWLGWLLVAVGMAAGLLMGMYAFDGPLPAPGLLGEYNDFGRRVSRLGHAYCIVLGLVSILLARDLDRTGRDAPVVRLGVVVFVAGALLVVLGMAVETVVQGPAAVLGIAPAVVAVGLVLARPPAKA